MSCQLTCMLIKIALYSIAKPFLQKVILCMLDSCVFQQLDAVHSEIEQMNRCCTEMTSRLQVHFIFRTTLKTHLFCSLILNNKLCNGVPDKRGVSDQKPEKAVNDKLKKIWREPYLLTP